MSGGSHANIVEARVDGDADALAGCGLGGRAIRRRSLQPQAKPRPLVPSLGEAGIAQDPRLRWGTATSHCEQHPAVLGLVSNRQGMGTVQRPPSVEEHRVDVVAHGAPAAADYATDPVAPEATSLERQRDDDLFRPP